MRNGAHEDSPFLGKGKYCGTPDELTYSIPTSASNQVFIQYVRELGSTYSTHNFSLHYEQVEYGCGGNVVLDRYSNPSTIITTPNYPNIPDPHIECIWRVSAANGDLLKIEFVERFDLTLTPNCISEYVEIREGSTSQSPALGTYCGKMPQPLYTTSNYARLMYFTDVAVPRNGFKANVSIARCGKSMVGRNGVISSPGYPGIGNTDQIRLFDMDVIENMNIIYFFRFFVLVGAYPTDAVCDYYITSTGGYVLNMTFTDLELPSSRNCSTSDHIEIFGMVKDPNNTETELLIATVCGSSIPQPILSYNHRVHIRFTSNSGNHMFRGFRLRYESVLDSCREDIEMSSGVITSPGYPIGQVTTRLCGWSITVPKGRRIKVDVLDFDVRSNQQQFYELAFYNDVNRISRIAYIRNESDVSGSIYSTDNTMSIRSAIRTNVGHRGFKLQFSSDEVTNCNGNLDGTEGILSGPANTSTYYCEYRRGGKPFFESDENQGTIAFKLNETPVNQSACTASMNTGINIVFQPYLARVMYTKCPRKYDNIASPYTSTKVSLLKTAASSFQISYKLHNCGGRIRASDDPFIMQPSFNATYGEVDCAYYFETTTSRTLQLTVTSSSFDCEKTYVNVYAGRSSRYPRIYRLCGNAKVSDVLNISSKLLFIEYHSDAYNPADTFRIAIDEAVGVCGDELQAPFYNFASPKNGTKYPANIECEWRIRARDGNHIGIYFPHRFQLEMSTNCVKDSFQIHEKVNGTWTEKQRFCGRSLPNYWNSTGNEVKVIFRTDGDGDGDGFSARWTENCGGVFQATQEIKTIVSPRYPHSYPKNADCKYSIRAKQNEAITVKFLEFELEDSTLTCKFDNVTLSKSMYGSVMETIGTYCSNNMLPMIRYQTRIDVAFKSDEFLERRGFKFTYHTDQCGGNITTSSRIQSTVGMNDTEYLSDSSCVWYITAPANQRIVVRIERLEMEHMYQCFADYIEVYEGHDAKAELRRARLCGDLTTHAPSVSINTNKGMVRFVTDSSVNKGGFSAEILFVNNCNRNIELNSSQSTYMLDNLSAAYEPLEDCEYFVKAPEGYIVAADFKQLHVAPCGTTATNNASCSCDYVQVRDGGGPFAEPLGKILVIVHIYPSYGVLIFGFKF